jgi:hypothetical protein
MHSSHLLINRGLLITSLPNSFRCRQMADLAGSLRVMMQQTLALAVILLPNEADRALQVGSVAASA